MRQLSSLHKANYAPCVEFGEKTAATEASCTKAHYNQARLPHWERCSNEQSLSMSTVPPAAAQATARLESPALARDDALCATGRRVIEIETDALLELRNRVDGSFAAACQIILAAEGRVAVLGMGKSGHIGRKIAATLASTGTPALFVHPGEASHGDLGMIAPEDVTILISNSGETQELLSIVPSLKRTGVRLIAMTGKPASQLARTAEVHIDVAVPKEACPLNLAPSASTTATLAMGDALAIALLEARGFTEKDFAHSHPGGSLGRRLLLHISDVMHVGEELPVCDTDTLLSEALVIMTSSSLGMVVIVDDSDTVLGIFTDGDLRRILEARGDVHELRMGAAMTPGGVTVGPHQLAAEALNLMETRKISGLPVVDGGGKLIGALNMHDLLRAGVY